MSRLLSNLRVRLFLLVILSVLPALLLTFYSGLEQRRMAADGAKVDALRLARVTSSSHGAYVEAARQMIIALSYLPEVNSNNPLECNPLLKRMGKLYPDYTSIAVIRPEGDINCISMHTSNLVNVADREYMQRALETGSFVVGEYIIGRLSGKIVLPLAYPVLGESGEVINVLLVTLDVQRVTNIASELDLPPGAVLLLISEEGTVLARYPNPEQWVGQTLVDAPIIQTILGRQREGTAEAAGLDGEVRLWAFTELAGSSERAFVSVGLPTHIAYAEVNRAMLRNISALGLVAVLAMALAWFNSDFFVLRHVNTLLKATKRMAVGELSTRVHMPENQGELGRLASSFNQMAQSLEERDRDLRQAELKYRTLVEQIPAITYTASLEKGYHIFYVSPQVENILGFLPDEWLSDHGKWKEQIHPDDCQRVLDQLELTRTKSLPFHCEYRLFARNGSLLWIMDDAVLINDAPGKPLFMQGIMLDITDRKKAEAALSNYAVQLERSNRELQDFAYIASHDLQEPLRKIQAFGERMEVKHGALLTEEGKDYLRRMRNSAARMQALINDLLSYSRVTSKAQPFVEVDLNEAAREVVSDLHERILKTGGQVKVNPLPKIEADPMQMRQLLQNLIGNALKFHKPDVPPQVTLSASIRQQDNSSNRSLVEISVEDNGIGFDEKYLERIFHPFQRLHGRGAYEGSGIGLAICRKIVERHSGSINARSTPGQGSTFLVTLPAIQLDDRRETSQ